MCNSPEHIKSYRRVKLKSNSIVYDIDKNLINDGTDEYWVCKRVGCKSNHVQSFLLARYSEQDEFTNPLWVRGQLIQFI